MFQYDPLPPTVPHLAVIPESGSLCWTLAESSFSVRFVVWSRRLIYYGRSLRMVHFSSILA